MDWLKATYGDSIGVAKAVRMMVRAFRNKVDARVANIIDEEPATRDVSLEQLDV